jgi:hypothetical protein
MLAQPRFKPACSAGESTNKRFAASLKVLRVYLFTNPTTLRTLHAKSIFSAAFYNKLRGLCLNLQEKHEEMF